MTDPRILTTAKKASPALASKVRIGLSSKKEGPFSLDWLPLPDVEVF